MFTGHHIKSDKVLIVGHYADCSYRLHYINSLHIWWYYSYARIHHVGVCSSWIASWDLNFPREFDYCGTCLQRFAINGMWYVQSHHFSIDIIYSGKLTLRHPCLALRVPISRISLKITEIILAMGCKNTKEWNDKKTLSKDIKHNL